MSNNPVDRRDFLKTAAGVGATIGAARALMGAKGPSKASSRIVGANDRINVAVVGVGGRGSYLAGKFAKFGEENPNSCQIVAVCDVYEKRKREAAEKHNVKGYLDYREVLRAAGCRRRGGGDAGSLARQSRARRPWTPARMCIVEKPMTHTIEEALQLSRTVRETKRVLQVGSQTTSADQWQQGEEGDRGRA